MGVSVPPAHGEPRLFSLDALAPDAPGPGETDEAIEDPPPPLDGAHEHPPTPPHLPPEEPVPSPLGSAPAPSLSPPPT